MACYKINDYLLAKGRDGRFAYYNIDGSFVRFASRSEVESLCSQFFYTRTRLSGLNLEHATMWSHIFTVKDDGLEDLLHYDYYGRMVGERFEMCRLVRYVSNDCAVRFCEITGNEVNNVSKVVFHDVDVDNAVHQHVMYGQDLGFVNLLRFAEKVDIREVLTAVSTEVDLYGETYDVSPSVSELFDRVRGVERIAGEAFVLRWLRK